MSRPARLSADPQGGADGDRVSTYEGTPDADADHARRSDYDGEVRADRGDASRDVAARRREGHHVVSSRATNRHWVRDQGLLRGGDRRRRTCSPGRTETYFGARTGRSAASRKDRDGFHAPDGSNSCSDEAAGLRRRPRTTTLAETRRRSTSRRGAHHRLRQIVPPRAHRRSSITGRRRAAARLDDDWDSVLGQPLTLTDPNGDVRHVVYDELERKSPYPSTAVPPHVRTSTSGRRRRHARRPAVWDRRPSARSPAKVPAGRGEPAGGTTVRSRTAPARISTVDHAPGRRFIVTGWKERDARGQVALSAEPFYSTVDVPAARRHPPSFRIRTFHHDALRAGCDLSDAVRTGPRSGPTFPPLQQTVAISGSGAR